MACLKYFKKSMDGVIVISNSGQCSSCVSWHTLTWKNLIKTFHCLNKDIILVWELAWPFTVKFTNYLIPVFIYQLSLQVFITSFHLLIIIYQFLFTRFHSPIIIYQFSFTSFYLPVFIYQWKLYHVNLSCAYTILAWQHHVGIIAFGICMC